MSRHPFRPDARTPAVIVPLTAGGPAELAARIGELHGRPVDAVEWRIDLFTPIAQDTDDAAATTAEWLETIAPSLPPVPLLVTFRTPAEGGAAPISEQAYLEVVTAAAESGVADAVDVEYRHPAAPAALSAAHRAGVSVVASHHDFQGTPPAAEIVAHLRRMESMGADVAKIAVTPRRAADVITLLAATEERFRDAERPIVTMSMGALGAVTRLGGAAFGSAATFATLGEASAPGQLPLRHVRAALDALAAAG